MLKKFFFFGVCASILALVGSHELQAKSVAKKSTITTPYRSFNKVHLLTLEQMAAIHPRARVQYIKYLRESLRDLESFQNVFKERLSAELTPSQKYLYAYLFLGEAWADPDVTERGGEADDACIYAYHLFNYEPGKDGKPVRNPFGCQKPASCGTNKVSCNFIISGLSGAAGCIASNPPYDATVRCDNERGRQSNLNKSAIDSAVKAARDYFKPEADGKISPDKMNSEEGRAKLAALLPHMYNDEVYADFIGLFMLYKKAGISLNLPEPYKSLGIDRLDTEHAKIADVINKIFAGHVRHCQNDLSKDLMDHIADESKWKEPGLMSSANREQQKIIKARLLKFRADKPGVTPKVQDVLQVDECSKMYARLKSLTEAADRAQGSLPVEVAGSDRRVLKTTGCSSIVSSDEDYVIGETAMCLICAAEKAVQNTADERMEARNRDVSNTIQRLLDSNRRTQGVENYVVSRKWINLLSTMAQACGRGDSKFVPEDTMLEMIQTYGHCHTANYDFPADLRESDYADVRKWARENQWNNMTEISSLGKAKKPLLIDKYGKRVPEPDKNGNFANMYGVSYSEATALFCDPSNFDTKAGRKTIAKSIEAQKSKFSEDGSTEVVKARINAANARMAKAVELAKRDDKSDPKRTAFLKCVTDSKKIADELYFEGSDACTSFKPVQNRNGSSRNIYSSFRADVQDEALPNPGNAIATGSRCDVARQLEVSKNGIDIKLAETIVADREYDSQGRATIPVSLFSSTQTINTEKSTASPGLPADAKYLTRDTNGCYDNKVERAKSGDLPSKKEVK